MSWACADLCDDHGDEVSVVELPLRRMGRVGEICGPAATISTREDNTLVRAALETAGEDRVLVVDGGGSMRCALVGDTLVSLAIEGGWAGIVVNGAIRDSGLIATMDLGVWALGTNPRRSEKADQGRRDVPVRLGATVIHPGDWVYVDVDGMIVAPRRLHEPPASERSPLGFRRV